MCFNSSKDLMMKHDNDRLDIYQKVTGPDSRRHRKGAGEWEMPWNQNSGMPLIVQSGRFYRGVNVPVLWATAQFKDYEDPDAQWRAKDAQVKKGEKSSLVVFWKFFDRPGGDETEAERMRNPAAVLWPAPISFSIARRWTGTHPSHLNGVGALGQSRAR
jgi:antirestriction protein ArdC